MATISAVTLDGSASPAAGRPVALQRRRSRWPWLLGAAVLAGLGWLALDRVLVDRRPILVGLLHSQTGPMAISEKSMIDAEVLALKGSTQPAAFSAARSAG